MDIRRLSRPAEQLDNHYETVVIGSGYGGGVAACRLARAGRQVCVLERGREFQPGEYPRTQFEGLSEIQYNTPEGHLGSRLGLFELHLNPDMNALVGCGLGGTSLINANVALRPDPRLWHTANWPNAVLADLATRVEDGYRHATDMLRPTPLPAGFPQLPKLDALQTSAAGLGWAEKFSRPPINVTFTDGVNHVGVPQHACVGCGDCVSGCNYAAKNTTLMNYLPDAVAHGAAIFTGVDVRSIAQQGEKWIVHYQPVGVGREAFAAPDLFLTADLVIIAAGTLGSTQILLRSKERGLAMSGRVGERLTGNGDVLAFGYDTDTPINGIGFGPKPPGEIPPVGPCIAGVIDNRDTANPRDGFVIEEGSIPGLLGAALPAILETAAEVVGKRTQAGVGAWLTDAARAAESLLRGPHHGAIANTQTYLVMAHDDGDGHMSLVDDRLRIAWPGVGSEPIFKTVNDTLANATAALGGGVEVPNPIWSNMLGRKLITVHPLGGCPMAERAEDGVVDHAGRVFAGPAGAQVYDGLLVADGSVLPTSLGVNPLLTIAALAERSCALLAEAKGWTIDYAFGDAAAAMAVPRLGLRFTETMRGVFTAPGSPPAAMAFTLTIASDDLDAMLHDSTHVATMMGTVTCAALSAQPLTVTDGWFNLFIADPVRVDHRLMVYRMVLHSVEGTDFYFHGVKTITDTAATDAWAQTTTLAVTLLSGTDEAGSLIGTGTLHILPLDFLTQMRTITVTNAPNVATRLKAIAAFGMYFAGVMWASYGGVVARQTIFNPDAEPRLKRTLRVGPAEIHSVQTADGVSLRLTRYKGGEKGPVVLLHGAGVSSGIFSTDLIDTNLLEYLYANGYDCWLSDFRVSIDLPSAALSSNADQVARYDHPATIARVLALTGKADVQVVAHCYGATTFTMALLAGIRGIRSVVLSQVSTHLHVPLIGEIKAGLHLPDILAGLGVQDMTAYRDTHADWQQRLLDDALRLYPIRHGEECRSAVCHRISFLYALLYEHANLSPLLHDNLHELFGLCSVETFQHLALMARVGHVVGASGAEEYLPHLDRMKLPIAFIHGGDNQCFLPDSTQTTFDLLRAANGPEFYTRQVIDGYGHIDCIFGKNAAQDVFPHILAHLEKTASMVAAPTSEPQTFRDNFVSLYQSVTDQVARQQDAPQGLATRPGLDNDLVRAATRIGALQTQGAATIPAVAPADIAQTAWTCAKMGFDLMAAKVKGQTALAAQLEAQIKFSVCDDSWIETITAYMAHFGPDGTPQAIPYLRAAQVGPAVLTMKAGAKIALLADWGTGTKTAVTVLQQIAVHKPDVLIHLGDIYYSGTATECDVNFRRIVDAVLDRAANPVPIYTLSGNHDMYSGGEGYYGLLKALNAPPAQQPASFFCLRSADQAWQFVAMDTGLHDYNPFNAKDAMTRLEPDEEAWLVDRIGEFPGRTILLSHHQLFSALSQIGPAHEDGSLNAVNPHLAASFARFSAAAPGRIAAWFWGHEHVLSLYQPYLGLARGRCIGHGAIPVFSDTSPYTVLNRIANPPALLPVQAGTEERVYQHGFAILTLNGDGSGTADYYDDQDTSEPIFSERL